MAVRRTRENKVTAQLKRESISYAFSASDQVTSLKPAVTDKIAPKSAEFFGYPISFIYQDLRRSLVVTGVILILLVGIAWWLRT